MASRRSTPTNNFIEDTEALEVRSRHGTYGDPVWIDPNEPRFPLLRAIRGCARSRPLTSASVHGFLGSPEVTIYMLDGGIDCCTAPSAFGTSI